MKPSGRTRALLLPAALLAAGCFGPDRRTTGPDRPGAPTVWNFTDPAAPLTAAAGKAVLSYWDPLAGGWGADRTGFGSASAFGLPLIDGKDFQVMRVPATKPTEGYSVKHQEAPNGMFRRQGYVSNYTLVFDLLVPPSPRSTYSSLLQADPTNRSDSEFLLDDRDAPAIGASGSYFGELKPGVWHRIAVVVQAAIGTGGTGQLQRFIDGVFAGGTRTPDDGPLNRWALGPEFLLFADDDGDTGEVFVKSILFTGRMLSMDEIRALGGPSSQGALVAGPAAQPIRRLAKRRMEIVGHRGGYACCAPENALESIEAAFNHGADHVEVDVRLSADGVAVLMHDRGVERVTDGTGRVSDMTLSELQRLDAGAAFSSEFAGVRVPTLADALRVARGRGRLLLDIKSADAGRPIARALKDAGAPPSAVWFSRNVDAAEFSDYRRRVPGAEMLWGGPPATLDDAGFAPLKALGITGFDVDITSASREFVDAAHARGMNVLAFTLLDPPEMLRAAEMGLDGVETDYPDVLDALMPERVRPRVPPGGYFSLPAQGCPAQSQFNDDHFRQLSGPEGSDFNRLIRGGAPTASGLACLQKMGVTDIIDLRDKGEGDEEAEASAAKALGLSYRRFPMTTTGGTQKKNGCAELDGADVARNRESVSAAAKFIGDKLKSPSQGKVFVHCAHGKDRTGLMLGVYRLQSGDHSKDEVASEMKSYRYKPYCALERVWEGY